MKKITILGLHLGFGGVEQSIISQANALCDVYDVELVVSYKLTDVPAFDVDPRVKIKYLTSVVPNEKEFKAFFRQKKFFKAFFEGLKSLRILYLKKNTMKKYIKTSNADIIVSSRVDIAKLLGKYKSKNVIAITEEHCHHNNNQKYIKKVVRACKNIDYLVAVSNELTNFYKALLKNTQCVFIPNGLEKWPNKCSELKNKNLISVGRFSKEKGFLDLVDVFSLVVKKDNTFHLDIIGFGDEFELVISKIKELQLEEKITLHGFQNREYINNILAKSSLYVMCSFEESFGTVLVEAFSLGVPAIAFDSAQGANEIISNKKNGMLIKNRNKDEMASKICDLVNNQVALKELGQNARIAAEKYSFDNIQKKWLDFMKEVKRK